VADLTATAEAIAHVRRARERVPVPPQQDELGRLATTFNAMLDSLDEAHRAQERFVSDASHELRAPLTAIQGNIELLRRQRGMSDADRDEALGEIERESMRLGRLVADLLALARADAGIAVIQRVVDMDAVILDAFRTARPLAHRQELRLDPFEPIQVCGDADRLTQLVLILLDNAIKYTPSGGSVTLGLASADAQAVITVADTGVGIAPADLPHVFERFYRADPARGRDPGGTGLGLPIAQWIATQHGGAIDLQSTPDQGTTVTVRLPLADTQQRAIAP
jgi:signal transduction histidine kinase